MSANQYQLVSHTGQVHPFGDSGLTIGRQRANQVVVSGNTVSRQHARVLVAAGKCWVRDENSAAGTFVNEQRVQGQQELKPGDILRIGNTNFRLVVSRAQPKRTGNLKTQQVLLIGAGLLVAVLAMMFMGSPGGRRPAGAPPSSAANRPSGEVVISEETTVLEASVTDNLSTVTDDGTFIFDSKSPELDDGKGEILSLEALPMQPRTGFCEK